VRNWNTAIGLLSLLFLISIADATTFYNSPLPNFTSFCDMRFANYQFQVSCPTNYVALQPSMTVSGIKYKINATTPNLSQFNQSVADKTTNYKFSFNVSVPAIAKSNVDSFSLDIVNPSGQVGFDNNLHQLYMEAITIDFTDLVKAGFSVTINSTNVVIGNIAGKEFDFDPLVQFSKDQVKDMAAAPLSDNEFIMAYCGITTHNDNFTLYYTNGTNASPEITFFSGVSSCISKHISVTALTSTLWAYCNYEDSGGTYNLEFYNDAGTNVTPRKTIVTQANGMSVSCSAINSTDIEYILHDVTHGYINGSVWHYPGNGKVPTKTYGQFIIESGVGGGAAQVTSVSAKVLNATAAFVCYTYYAGSTHLNCTVVNFQDGTRITTQWNPDSSTGQLSMVSTSCFNQTACSLTWISSSSSPIKMSMADYWTNGTQIGTTQTVETPSKDTSGYAFLDAGSFNNTHNINGWYNGTLERYSIWDSTIAKVVGPTTVATPTATYPSVAIATRELATNIRFCSATDTVTQYFISAFAYSSSVANWTAYYSNGTAWNGVCPAAGGATTSKALYDSATYAELETNLINRVEKLYDYATYAELQLRNLTLTIRLYDYKTYAELLVTSALHPRTFYDSVTYAELQTKLSTFPRVLYDSATYAENAVKNSTFYRVLYDYKTCAELVVKNSLFVRTLYDYGTYTENMVNSVVIGVKNYAIYLYDTAVYVENALRGLVLTIRIYDAVSYYGYVVALASLTYSNVIAQALSYIPPLNIPPVRIDFSWISVIILGCICVFGANYLRNRKPNTQDEETLNEEFPENEE
jgi:hypothetical protein